ncbi:hypothetical protein [Flavobacterium limnophilum]|uniref:hypothetical protein n=1 Tax=Flavobacterium limnophilum TaxID=3003262 RepID=UPI0022AC3BDC|nr:hypothetical protein [Flavobacterium limnophilum]
MKFPIVIHQKPTILEIFFIIIILSITFIPFVYGINTKHPIFCISLILGIICFIQFNKIRKGKFTPLKMIQKTIVVSFSENNIEINENKNSTIYKWSDLQEIEINIFAYKGRFYGSDNRTYNGIENSIKFIKNEQKFKYQFYIENINQFKLLKEQFKTIILPQLKQFQNLKKISRLQSQLNFARDNRNLNLNNDIDYLDVTDYQ